MPTRKIVFPSIVLFLVIVLATFLAACGGDEATPTPTQEASMDSGQDGVAMEKDDGDAMEKDDGDAMEKDDGDAMEKDDGDAMEKDDGDAMEKDDGDAMEKDDGDAMEKDDGDAMEKDDGDAMEKDGGDAMEKDDGDAMTSEDLPANLIAPHFVNSFPGHGQTYMQAPELIVINFNFNLHDNSDITVTRDGHPVNTATRIIDSNRLTLRTTLGSDSGDGVYTVQYRACWPDASCHEGQLGFIVDSKSAAYVDMTGEREVMIDLMDVQFAPAKVIVSRGTVVTWRSADQVVHFVNSDPHPSHNVLPGLNSVGMENGDTFSYTFDEPGEWSYHCAAPTGRQ